jgi:putative ABC transport system permease protein
VRALVGIDTVASPPETGVPLRAGTGPADDGIRPSRVLPADLLRLGLVGPRSRRLRTVLTAIGIAIGVAAMVGVLGISESSRADLLAQLDRFGTNLLTVQAGQSLFGDSSTLPLEARAMIGRIGPVEGTAVTAAVSATARRTDKISAQQTQGIGVAAATIDLLSTVQATVADGAYLNQAAAQYPAVVLGSVAAQRLGIATVDPAVQVYIGGQWFTVVGILDPVVLTPELDTSALMGFPIAESLFGIDGSAGTIYVRSDPDEVTNVWTVLSATANPEHPEEVQVSRPSDVIAAKAAASNAFTLLFLGLAAVALGVAAIGIANVMLMSVLERRSEIGLRRSIGATRPHIALQFLVEALILGGAGGLLGVAAGAGIAAGFAQLQGWLIVIPPIAVGGGLTSAVLIGALAGLYPAIRAARISPTEALRSV